MTPTREASATQRFRSALEATTGVPFTDGNLIQPLRNGCEIFPQMLDAIEHASSSIDFLTYVYWRGDIARRFADVLAAKARDGVRVRVVLDAFGCRPMSEQVRDTMADAGVEIRWFRPLATWRVWRNDKRTHRKLLVIDDQIGFTGGVGIAQEWEGDAQHPGQWRDTHFRLRGPCIDALSAAFLDNWNECGAFEYRAPEQPRSPEPDGCPTQIIRASSTVGWEDTATLFRTLVALARERLDLMTPYFTPDDALVELLIAASKRGVAIRIIIPGPYADTRLPRYAGWPSIGPLLEADIQIAEYQPTFPHAKITLVDSAVVCMGSANLNHRSMSKDEECCAVVLSGQLAGKLAADYEADWERSRPLQHADWARRSVVHRLKERCARLWVEQL